jgi:hypothetical protein
VPTAGFPGDTGWLGGGFGAGLPVGTGVGAGPDAARVVDVARGPADVTVVELAVIRVRAVVAVVAGAAVDTDVPGMAAVVTVVSTGAEVTLVVVLSGAPAMANEPPRLNAGGPLWVSL